VVFDKFEHIKRASNGGADDLSRLPKTLSILGSLGKIKIIFNFHIFVEIEDYFHFIVERTPIDAAQIKKELRKDKTLSKVYLYARDG